MSYKSLGIELGSTRIKCTLVNENGEILSSGSYEWENELDNGYWSYDLNKALNSISTAYSEMKHSYIGKYKEKLTTLSCIGISAMMHGLIALDKNKNLLTPFRTWRNINTQQSADELSKILNSHIPARWSIAHLYDVIKKKEPFYQDIEYIETLSSYIHYKLTNKRAIGIGDASGIFPTTKKEYDLKKIDLVQKEFLNYNYIKNLYKVFPPIYEVGFDCSTLTKEGALILDKEGDLQFDIPFCPPEGDAQTGMIATNTIKNGQANISCGTSIFGNFVLTKPLLKKHEEIDIVSSPLGDDVAMIHCNNCTSALNEVYKLTKNILESFGIEKNPNEIYKVIFSKAIESSDSIDNLVLYNYLSSESITKVNDGSMFVAKYGDQPINIGTLTILSLFSCFTTFSIGMEILKEENISIKEIFVHGGIFKTKGCCEKIFASVLNQEILLNEEGSQGGSYGMAILALYSKFKSKYTLEEFLDKKIFKEKSFDKVIPSKDLSNKFKIFKKNFSKCLPEERKLGEKLKTC